MSEKIKPDLILNMKREWFAKVWNGDKTVEYRECKPYWDKRIGDWVGQCGKFVLMVLGYRRRTPAILLQVDRVSIGGCPYEGWNGEYYRLHFTVVRYYFKDCNAYMPIMKFIPMKEKEGGAE